MAIGSGTFTLADYALYSNQPLVQAVSMSLIDYGNIIQDVPLVPKQTLQANGVRFEGNLPTINWSPINAEGVTVHAQPTPYQEQAYLMRNYVDVDKYIVMDQNQITDTRASQAKAVLKALTYDINFKFFKNAHDGTGDPNAPVGLRARIDDAASANKFGVRPENKIDAGGATADISQAGISAAKGNAFLEMLDLLLWSVGSTDGTGIVLYMNDYMMRRLNFVLRSLGTTGGLNESMDQFNRTITKYKQATIRDPGVKSDQTTRIIAGNAIPAGSGSVGETAAGVDSTGASANFTSIYAVNYGTDNFFGWQFTEGPNVQDLGLINNGVIYRTLIDWAVGFMNANTRSIARLYDIKIG
jgi:hypothetical protein